MEPEWMSVARRRQRSASLGSACAGESRGRSASGGSEGEMEATTSKASQRNYLRRQRRRLEAAQRQDEEAEPSGPADRASLARQLKKVRKALRAVDELAGVSAEALSVEQRAKLGRRCALEASEAATAAMLDEVEREEAKQDAIAAALDAVRFDAEFECGVCFEVVEVPTAVSPCGHEFCRACVESVVRRARRGSEVACPLCRAVFYDGAARSARLKVAHATRHKLKTASGTCHCGETLPLSTLREHLRRCGDAAPHYAPRAKFGHAFAKPDFAKAAAEHAQPLDGPTGLAAAMARRFRASDGARRAPTPRAPPTPTTDPRADLDSTPPPPSTGVLESSESSSTDSETSAGSSFSSPTPSSSSPAPRRRASPPTSPWLRDAKTPTRHLGGWATPETTRPPSVHDILAEEEAKKQDLAERLASPWNGAVARHLRQAEQPAC